MRGHLYFPAFFTILQCIILSEKNFPCVEFNKIFFVPGKRKGYLSFKVVNRSNKSQRSTVNLLPSALPPEHVQPNEQPMQEEIREEEEGEYLCGDKPESEEDEVPTAYQMRRERLSKHWKALRMTLLKSFLQL